MLNNHQEKSVDIDEHSAAVCERCNPKVVCPELDKLIKKKQITTLFQPIINLQDGSIFAYEALSRGPEESYLHMPEALFMVARKYNRLYALDCVCREKSIANFNALNLSGQLSINIDPYSLMDPDFETGQTLSLLKKIGIPNERVILELTEHSRTDCYDELSQAVAHYRAMGFSIALDDLGAGYSNLRLMIELEPEYIKLDKYYISELPNNKKAHEFVKLIVNLASEIDCKVIAEGIESEADLDFVRGLSIDYAQGYLLGRPKAEPKVDAANLFPAKLKNKTTYTSPCQSKKEKLCGENVSSLSLKYIEPCSSRCSIPSVLSRFQDDGKLRAIPVVDDGQVVGVLVRDAVLRAFSVAFGHSLNHKKLVANFMHNKPIVIKPEDKLTDVSELAMARPDELIYTPITVCDQSGYLGVASIRELLEKITQNQVDHARHSSPLTGLPGNISIETEIDCQLQQQKSFVCCYFDLDNFKAFNDVYGFERGNVMIRLLADLLGKYKAEQDFIGHVGGDDFVFISNRDDWEESIHACLKDFEKSVPYLYDEADRLKGGIRALSRQGETCEFPFSSLSVAALPCAKGNFASRLEISSILFELKHLAKKEVGNSLVIERRK